jgi:hypothetical protein
MITFAQISQAPSPECGVNPFENCTEPASNVWQTVLVVAIPIIIIVGTYFLIGWMNKRKNRF